ncbi:hypothetical protein CVT24_000064 [Panaeolus cyanescens]|uniref:Uncharacterized protein n=1 Tax=Panaeolus cyanescens TaxID=181874 RepID=A0A409VWE7_9AGAR|nr:hypothetical protein CVT24_000064 [Panaeolus cyanescens]
MKESKNHWYSIQSLPCGPLDWKYTDIDRDSRTIIAKSMTLTDLPWERMVDLIAVVSRIEEYPNSEYGIGINVKSLIQNQPGTRWKLCRCDKLDIVVRLSHASTFDHRPVKIRAYRPLEDSPDEAESTRYFVKRAGQGALGDKGSSIETRPDNTAAAGKSASTTAITSRGPDNLVRWTLKRHTSDNAGIPDCDLGLVITAPSPEIEIYVNIRGTYRASHWVYRLNGRNKSNPEVAGKISLNLQDSITLGFTGANQSKEDFLKTCTLEQPVP